MIVQLHDCKKAKRPEEIARKREHLSDVTLQEGMQ